jgi:hypothetical protein
MICYINKGAYYLLINKMNKIIYQQLFKLATLLIVLFLFLIYKNNKTTFQYLKIQALTKNKNIKLKNI